MLSANEYLANIFGVLTKINNKMGADDKKDSSVASTGVQSLVASLKSLFKDPKQIDQTTKSLSSLFKVLIDFSKKETQIKNLINLFDSLTKSLTQVNKVVRGIGLMFLGIGAAVLMVAGALKLSAILLGVEGPEQVMTTLTLTVLTIAGIMYLLSKASETVDKGSATGKAMGQALMYIAGGALAFVVAWELIAMMLGAGEGVKGMLIAAAIIVGVIIAFAGIFWLLGKMEKAAAGAETAKAMGIGLVFIAGGLLAITGIAWLISKLDNPIKDMLTVVVLIAAFVGIFWLMGTFWKVIAIGTLVTIAFAIGVFILSLALKPIVDIANMIEKMKDPEKTFKTLGLIVAALIGIFLIVGQPEIAWVVATGALVISAMLVPLLMITTALEQFARGTKMLMETANTFDVTKIKPTVSTMIGGVLSGFIEGVSTALAGGKKGWAAIPEAIKNSAIIFAGIGMLMGVSVSLSLFASAISSFATPNQIKVIEGTDKDGKPIFGPTVNVDGVGSAISSTLTTFLTKLIASTTNLTTKQGPAIRKMARALTGRRGMLSAIIGFAEAIKVYSQFGNKNEIIGIELVDTGRKDGDGLPIMKEVKTNVSVPTVVKNMISSFETFLTALSNNVETFAKISDQGYFSPVRKMARALTGRKGILSAVTGFADALMVFSKFGEDNRIPLYNEDGTPKLGPDNKPMSISMDQIANNIVTALTTFSTVFADALNTPDAVANANKAKSMLGQFDDLIEQFGKLAEVDEGLSKVANTIGLLATNIGLLSTNMTALDPGKLASITGVAANITKGSPLLANNVSAGGSGTTNYNYNTTNMPPASGTPASKGPEMDWNQIAQLIGSQVASSMQSVHWKYEIIDKNNLLIHQ